LAKAAEGARKAQEKAAGAAAGGGGGGADAEISYTVKNDKWLNCDLCKQKVRNPIPIRNIYLYI